MVTQAGPSVVVADVVPLVRAGLAAVLSTAGFRVVGDASCAADLPDLVGQLRPGVVVLGAVADLGPADAVRRLRADASPTCIVLLLNRASRASLAELLSLDVEGLLARSTQPDALVAALGKAWRGERIVDPALLADDRPDDDSEATALTGREREVLELLSGGQSNREIAAVLYISLPTVKTHLAHIYAKLGAKNRNEALGRAMALGLLGKLPRSVPRPPYAE
ncbi:MAG: response regulator transcription factor [Actinobacteria bacterium]|nr:response regulator transcription factor [Actinomycetota bacterium]